VAPHGIHHDSSSHLGCNRQQGGHGGTSDGTGNIDVGPWQG
jgi:hypothetical protein